jgi:hypothetical protein
MPDVTVFVPKPFPYTFPFTFGVVEIGVQAASHEPVLPIEYRYTLPDFFFVQEPSTWLGFVEVLQGMEELLMPIWPSEDIYGAIHNIPYVFGGTDLPQLFDEADLTWYSQPATLMPEYHPRDLYGLFEGGISGGNWVVMVLSTPTFLPDGTAASPPTSTTPSPGTGSGQTSTRSPGG